MARMRFGRATDGSHLNQLPYIFVIGFNKTGTRSLTNFFECHGIPSVHWDNNRLVRRMLVNLSRGTRILKGYDLKYTVFSDFTLEFENEIIEGNQFFISLFRDYPGSLFILNTRPTKNWIESRVKHYNGAFLARQMRILGTDNPEQAISTWERQKAFHEDRVRDFFRQKPGQFLEIDIESENVPSALSKFLPFRVNPDYWLPIGKSTEDVQASLERAIALTVNNQGIKGIHQ
jgi:hypothetical protein